MQTKVWMGMKLKMMSLNKADTTSGDVAEAGSAHTGASVESL